MQKLLKAARTAAERARLAALAFYRRYPARCNSYIASGIVFVAGLFGVVIGQQGVLTDIALVAPFLIAGEGTHRLVKPVAK
jgi:hypothetical protein